MPELNIDKFEPKRVELVELAKEAFLITAENPLKEIMEMRKRLQKARTSITNAGKEIRNDAIAFQKAVIAHEKDLVGIVQPEEDRLSQLEFEAEQAEEMERRAQFLPRRRTRLNDIDPALLSIVTDEKILSLDGAQFEGFINECVAAKNESDRKKIDADRAKIDEEKNKIAREKELAEAEERGRKAAEEKKERDEKERSEREAREKQEADRKAEEVARKIAEDKKYQDFLAGHGYNSEEFHTTQNGNTITLWKKIAVHILGTTEG